MAFGRFCKFGSFCGGPYNKSPALLFGVYMKAPDAFSEKIHFEVY